MSARGGCEDINCGSLNCNFRRWTEHLPDKTKQRFYEYLASGEATSFMKQFNQLHSLQMFTRNREAAYHQLDRTVNRLLRQEDLGARAFSTGKILRDLPTFLAMSVLLLDRRDREEVLADLEEWYQDFARTRGVGYAKFLVCLKIMSAYSGRALRLAESVAGIVGMTRGTRKTQ